MRRQTIISRRYHFSGVQGLAFLAFGLLLSQGCAHYTSETRAARNALFNGNPQIAITQLEPKSKIEGKDQLLYLLDLGIAYFNAQQYDEAIKVFLKAADLTEIKDVTKISEEASTFLVTDNAKNYKGEDFEKVLIHVYLALSFTMKGNLDGALVECRRVNQLLYRFISEGKRPYEQNPLAYYLSGILYEKTNQLNDAYIDYKSVQRVMKDFKPIASDLVAASKKLGFEADIQKWVKLYGPNPEPTPANPFGRKDLTEKGYGEVVILVEIGRAPEKIPDPNWTSLPMFRSVPFNITSVDILLSGKKVGTPQLLFSVDQLAKKNLAHRIGAMTAKKIVGVGAKAAVGYGIAKASDNDDLGKLVAYLLIAADQADLRSWQTLPAEFHIARLSLPEGKHILELNYNTRWGTHDGTHALASVDLRPGQHVILHHRIAR